MGRRPTAEAAAQVLGAEFAPISDMRASASYRRTVLANLLRRFRLETGGARVPTRVEQVADAAVVRLTAAIELFEACCPMR